MKRRIQMPEKSRILQTFLNCRSQLVMAIKAIVKEDDVDDIVQETFVKSYAADLRQNISYEKTYMLKTAKNLALNHVLQASVRLNDSLDNIQTMPPALYSKQLEKQFESKERFLHFCRATDTLSPEIKRVFLLKKVYGLSQRDIAARLNLSESTVEKHVAKGLKHCALYLQRINQPAVRQRAEGTVGKSRS